MTSEAGGALAHACHTALGKDTTTLAVEGYVPSEALGEVLGALTGSELVKNEDSL